MSMTWANRTIVVGVLVAGFAATSTHVEGQAAQAAMADAVRGEWEADVDGTRHIFVLKVSDAVVSGVYCAVDCSDPARLAFVDRGALTPDGVRFEILEIAGGVQSRTRVVGRLADQRLMLTLTPPTKRPKAPRALSLHRDSRKPVPVTVEEFFASRGIESGPLVIAGSSTPYIAPGPNETLTAKVLEGLWVWGTGPDKQHFIFRRVGEGILGVVCGPCDNPYTFGFLDNAMIDGDTFTFDINHQDWGIGIEYGPYVNHATATLSHYELHLRSVQHNGPRTIEGDLVLIGPLRTAPP